MKISRRILCLALLLLIAAGVQAQEPGAAPPPPQQSTSPAPPTREASFEVSGRYTAQRRPRVTVLTFDDTNTEAQSAHYGSSVEAMLVTFLKRKSQFVVVERQKLDPLFDEEHRRQKGMINIDPADPAAKALLEKIDAFILGNVTLLNIPTEQATAQKPGEKPEETGAPPSRRVIQGPRIEVDAKLLSRLDGRIIAAAQRSGPVACLRGIIERLGVALEQDFLRPYYGKLKINLMEPENVRIFLTPILLDTALDEEKPPVEGGSTVTIGGELDHIEPWMTDPTTYTVENLLSGWYSMRLERPGYEELKTDPARWQARDLFGQVEVYDHTTGLPLTATDPELRRFVVRVDPLTTEVIDGDARKFVFRKQGGSLAPRVKRQYLDADFSQVPRRVILMGGKGLDLNQSVGLKEFADDQRCDLFEPRPFVPPNYGRTYIAAGQKFDFDKFKGGELIIEDYQDEIVPVGQYQLALWEPNYEIEKSPVTVRDRDDRKVTRTSLVRETLKLELDVTGPRPANRMILEGRDTRYRREVPLDFTDTKEQPGLPADAYTASTNIPGLDAWKQSTDLFPASSSPPMYYTRSPFFEPKITRTSEEDKKPVLIPRLTVKTRLGLAGRLDVFSRPPDPLAADLFVDREVLKILNLLLYGQEQRPEEEKKGLLQVASRVGHSAVRVLADTPIVPATPAPRGASAGGSGAPPQPGATDALGGNPNPADGTGATSDEEEKKAALPPGLPRDPDELRELLAQHLRVIDLLVLDPRDMAQLRRSPEVAAIVARWVEAGGALFAFVAEIGSYGEVVGAPLVIEGESKPTDRFNLALGDVAGVVLPFDKKAKIKVKSRRPLPGLSKLLPQESWRVLAFTQARKEPRIIERGKREGGGYVAVWLDEPSSFRGRQGGTVPKVEETRAKLEDRILEWARYLMYRRYDKGGEQRRQIEQTLTW